MQFILDAFFLLWYRYYSVKYNLDFHFLSIFRDVFRKEVNEHKPREKKLHGENKRLSWFMKDCLNCQRILDMIDGILNSDCVFMFFFVNLAYKLLKLFKWARKSEGDIVAFPLEEKSIKTAHLRVSYHYISITSDAIHLNSSGSQNFNQTRSHRNSDIAARLN